MEPRTQFILTAAFVVTTLAALVIGLTVGLRTPGLPNGGSPPWPSNITTTESPDGSGEAMDTVLDSEEVVVPMGFFHHIAKEMFNKVGKVEHVRN